MSSAAPSALVDMIELPPQTMSIIQSAIRSPAGGNLMFHGPGGTGKSAFCKVIAIEAMRYSGLVVSDFRAALSYPNLTVVNHATGYTKVALEQVRAQARMHTLTATDRRWIIVEEFDSIGLTNTNYVKTWLDELGDLDTQVFVSTNNRGNIDDAVRTRFSELYLGLHPSGTMRTWAIAELKRLGALGVTDAVLSQLVNNAAGSIRALQRGCLFFAEHGTVV